MVICNRRSFRVCGLHIANCPFAVGFEFKVLGRRRERHDRYGYGLEHC